MIAAIHKQRVLNTALLSFWRDGVEMSFYNGKLHTCFGWNSDYDPPLQVKHERFNLDGTAVEALTDIPYAARHTHLQFVEKDLTGTDCIYCMGAAGTFMDLIKYKETSSAEGTWSQVYHNWNIDAFGREHFARTYDQETGYAYILGGFKYGFPTVKMPFLYRAHKSDEFATWEKICDLPIEMQNADSGCLVKFKGALWFFGGGDVSADIPYYVNTNIFKSIDGGFTWTKVKSEPLFNSGIWGDAIATDHCVIYLSGSDANNSLTANNRLLITYDMQHWYRLSLKIQGRHATARCKDAGDNVYFAMGYLCNDLIQFKKIADINGVY